MKTIAFAACALAAFLSGPAPAAPAPQEGKKEGGAEKVALRLNVRKGDRFAFRLTSDIDNSTKMGQMDMGSKIQSEQAFSYTVEEVAEDGSAWVEVKFGAIRGKLTAPMMGEMEFDSTEPADDENPMASMATKPFTALAGKAFRMRIAPSGRVEEIRGATEAMKGIFDGGTPGGERVAQMMKGKFTDEGMKPRMQSYLTMLPEAPVAPGGTWQVDLDFPMGGAGHDLAVRGTSTLEKADGEAASVATEGTISPAEKTAPEGKEGAGETSAIPPGMKIEKGEMRRAARVSRKDGLPLGLTIEVKMELTVPNPMGGEMKMTQSTKMALERTALPAEEPANPASRPAGKN